MLLRALVPELNALDAPELRMAGAAGKCMEVSSWPFVKNA
jgi:hypothetical protein